VVISKFGDDKEKNIYQMLLKMEEQYRKLGKNPETAKVFEGKRSSMLYDTNTCIAEWSTSSDSRHSVKVGKSIKQIIARNLRQKNEDFVVTAFHNHRNGNTFSLYDLGQMMYFPHLRELFLDTDVYVRVLIRANHKIFNSKEEIMDTFRVLVDIHNTVSTARRNDYVEALDMYRKTGDDLHLKKVNALICEEFIREVNEMDIFKVNVESIRKEKLRSYGK